MTNRLAKVTFKVVPEDPNKPAEWTEPEYVKVGVYQINLPKGAISMSILDVFKSETE